MKTRPILTLLSCGLATLSLAQEEKPTEKEKAKAILSHQDGSDKVSIDQDKQSGDVQELLTEQTDPKVIKLLTEVEVLMAKTTDRLEDANTSGETIAMQTEIIEKIYEAAKAKNASSPSGGPPSPGSSAMLEMMEQMMGKGQGQPAESKKGGEGSTGDSDAANTENSGDIKRNTSGERRVPRAAGKSGAQLPAEFQRAIDGYNKKSPSK